MGQHVCTKMRTLQNALESAVCGLRLCESADRTLARTPPISRSHAVGFKTVRRMSTISRNELDRSKDLTSDKTSKILNRSKDSVSERFGV